MVETESIKKEIVGCGKIPKHIAIIMDGNGRWARSKGFPRVKGHEEGVNSVREIVEACGEIDVSYLTLYTFSAENWKRPQSEVSALMKLLLTTVRAEISELNKNNVRLQVLGNLQDLPFAARKGIEGAIAVLKGNTGLTLNLALSYSSRREIVYAVKQIVEKVNAGEISIDSIDENLVSSHLYTNKIPDPDFLIRTSGELRISNFLLWQLAYTEIYVSSVYWPDFRKREFFEAIRAYQNRERRFGKVSEQLTT